MDVNHQFEIRDAMTTEFVDVGNLMVQVYSSLEGFPNPEDQPQYYDLLRNVGALTQNSQVRIFVAQEIRHAKVAGTVVYFSDMAYYGSGGTATQETQSSGFRLLAVSPEFRGQGLGKRLSMRCIEQAQTDNNRQIIIHSTKAMAVAWKMYERLGFRRSEDLDFQQQELPVFGFRMNLRGGE